MVDTNIPPGGKMPSKAELRRQTGLGALFNDATGLSYDRRTKFGKIAGEVYSGDDSLSAVWGDTGYQGAGLYYDPDRYDSRYLEDEIPDDEAAAFSKNSKLDVPTSSTNFSRPRTVAAAYDPDREVMTVVFRDGTFYNYYQVTDSEWTSFQASFSKGRPWLNHRSNSGKPGAQAVDGLFIGKPRGPADPGSIPPEIREQLYRVSRTNQIMRQRYMRPGKTAHSATQVYTGGRTRRGPETATVREPNQRAVYRAPKSTSNPGKNPARLGQNPYRSRKAS